MGRCRCRSGIVRAEPSQRHPLVAAAASLGSDAPGFPQTPAHPRPLAHTSVCVSASPANRPFSHPLTGTSPRYHSRRRLPDPAPPPAQLSPSGPSPASLPSLVLNSETSQCTRADRNCVCLPLCNPCVSSTCQSLWSRLRGRAAGGSGASFCQDHRSPLGRLSGAGPQRSETLNGSLFS